MNNIFEGLNEDQLKPVKDFMGPSLIIAGPGAGKTKTIISRSANMIANGINPREMILFTFTNKAAKEIRDRVVAFIGKPGELITVGTYHSVCARFLRKYAHEIGYTNRFTIYDTEETSNILKKLAKKYNEEEAASRNFISDCKNRNISPSQAIQQELTHKSTLAVIYREYQAELKRRDAMDFDDLIGNMIKILETCPHVKAELNERYKYITADEAHDSSSRDLRLIELLSGERQNMCMILDPNQSIYGFRGADLESVLNVRNVYRGLKTFILHRNYRSTQKIVQASESLIAHNSATIEKDLYSRNEVGDNPIYYMEYDQSQEAARVAVIIKAMMRSKGLKYSDFCILYRMSYMSRAIEEAFIKSGIKYEITDGTPFFGRMEIKDLVSYIRLIYNPYDFESFKRAVGIPKRGLGDKRLEKIDEYVREHQVDYLQALKEMEFTGKMKTTIKQFSDLVEDIQEAALYLTPSELVKKIYNDIQYSKHLESVEKEDKKREERMLNCQELINLSLAFETVEDFLDTAALRSNQDEDDQDTVKMMTQHASKGLEFPCVIIIGCNEGTSPHYRATRTDQIEEERRLFYVAMTRAEKYLFLTRPQKVVQQGRFMFPSESRFIREIDPKLLDKAQ